eukprot:6203822-Pleurochrysis_carterae.AAC.1
MDYAVPVGPFCRHSPSDERDNTSHSQNDGNSANHRSSMSVPVNVKLDISKFKLMQARPS